MKKLLYCAAALAMAFFAGSCQQENLEPVAGNGTVTFTVEAPANVQTKAIADGLNVNELVYEVWLTENLGDLTQNAQKLYQAKAVMAVDKNDGKNKATLTLDLVNDQKFTVLFWAQVGGTGVYNTTELNAVTYTHKEAKAYTANDENLAAFYAVAYVNDCMHVKKDGTATGSEVVLRRPFAQLNLGTLNTSTEYTVDLVSSKVKVTNANTVFNVATSQASEPQVMEFRMNGVPTNPATLTVNTTTTTYEYAGMNYLFAGDNATVEYDIQTVVYNNNATAETGMTAHVTNTVSSVPLKENYRTNIIGNLLTSDVDYQIVVDADFNTPDEVVEVVSVSTAAELVAAITVDPENAPAEGETTNIKFEGDINLDDLFASLASTKSGNESVDFITIPAGNSFTLDLNGYSLTGVDKTTTNFGLIQNNGTLTVSNSSSNPSRIALVATQNSGWGRYSAVISNNPGATLTVGKNVLVEHLGGTDMAYGIDALTNGGIGAVKTTIDGATVKSTYRAVRQFLNSDVKDNELVIKAGSVILGAKDNKAVFFHDPSTKANKGKLTIEEGAEVAAVYLFVTAGSTEWPVEVSIAASSIKDGYEVIPANVPEGYSFIEKDGVYTVSHDYVMADDEMQIFSAYGLKTFAEMVNGGEAFQGKNVILASDIDLENQEWIPIGTETNCFMGNFDGNNKVIRNLKITTHENTDDGYAYAGLFGVTEGSANQHNSIADFVIENVNIQTTGQIVSAAVAYPYYTDVENITVKGDISIKGGSYTAGVLGYTRRCVNAKNLTIEANEGSTIEGDQVVGGVISDIQMNGGLKANYFNFKSAGLTIKANKMAGGVSGIICQQTLDGATVENVTLVCDDVRTGIVSGADGGNSTLTNVTYNNVKGATRLIGATYEGNYPGKIVEIEGVKAVVYSIENGTMAVSVEEMNLNGKNLSDATAWAEGLGEGWSLASIDELDAIWAVRSELNDALEADDTENALFNEEDYWQSSSKYALYLSSTEAVGDDPQGQAYISNRVFVKYFNLTGYWDYDRSTFATISKYAPLKDNYFARAVYAL